MWTSLKALHGIAILKQFGITCDNAFSGVPVCPVPIGTLRNAVSQVQQVSNFASQANLRVQTSLTRCLTAQASQANIWIRHTWAGVHAGTIVEVR